MRFYIASIAWLLLAVADLSTTIHAFGLSTKPSTSGRRLTFLHETVEKHTETTTLTDEDEAVLFGHDALEERHPPYPARHRSRSKAGNILEDPLLPLDPLEHSADHPQPPLCFTQNIK